MASDNRIGFVWLYGLVVMFVLGIIELLILPALESRLIPPMLQSANQTLSSADAAEFATNVSRTLGFMDAAMYLLMAMVVIYMIISIFKKEEYVYQP